MMFNRYKVSFVDRDIRSQRLADGKPDHWLIIAKDLPSAWGKFATQYFGPLKPNPADYDISYHDQIRA